MSNIPAAPSKPKEKRERLSVDLSAYPDVLRMLERMERDYKNVNRTVHVIAALRSYLTEQGYAGKKDLIAAAS